jgi:Protein kinase domain
LLLTLLLPYLQAAIDVRARFLQLLSESSERISRPKLDVLSRLHQLRDTVFITAATPAEALNWYSWARDQPLSPTRGRFRSVTGYLLNGPSTIDAKLILAYDPAGSPAMFKIMASKDCPEVLAAVAVNGVPNLVPCTFRSAEKENGDFFCGLLMPKYDRSLFSVPDLVLSEALLLERAQSLLAAVRHMHSVGFIHMDIKEANVFVGFDGSWWLGDFGSAVREGEPITSTTRGLHPELTNWHLLSKPIPAERRYDMFMLVGLLVRQLDSRSGTHYAEEPPSLVLMRKRALMVENDKLKLLLVNLIDNEAAVTAL